MIKPRVVYIIIISVFAVILIFVLGYYIFYKRILADSVYGPEINKTVKQVDFNGDGINEAIIVSEHQKNGNNIFLLEYKSKKEIFTLELKGFESIVDFCPDPFPKMNDSTRIICLYGPVGVHSQNVEFVRLINSQLKSIDINSGDTKLANISSDAPKFGFEDLNQDGNLYLYIDDRNYDLDPILDSWRSYYYFKDNEFIFDHKVALENGIETSNQQGKIN